MSHTNSTSNHGMQWSQMNTEWSNKDMKRGSGWNTDEMNNKKMKNEDMDNNDMDSEDTQSNKEWGKSMSH